MRLIIQEVKPLHADEVESKTKETGARKSKLWTKVNGHVRRLATLEPQIFAISVMISPALKTG